jgi:hypothetical protein
MVVHKLKKMKRLFLFIPAVFLAGLLLNSFVLKEKDNGERTSKGIKPLTNDPVPKVKRNVVFKSVDGGLTWQDVSGTLPENEQAVNSFEKEPAIVESDGVLIARDRKGIKRSTDNGKHWEWVISEGGVGIAIERIQGGFAAISYDATTKSRRIRISLDRGQTWQAIDKGLTPSLSISSIKQVGKYLICGHPDGIFRSSDMGKTWNKVHQGVDKNDVKLITTWNSPFSEPQTPGHEVLKIYTSGNVLYAVAVSAGC